jgi:glycosyltransferase involved in cell wall biosynthesis
MLVGPFPPTKGGVTTFMLNLMASPLAAQFEFVPFTTSRPPKKNVVNNWGYRAVLRGGLRRIATGLLITIWHVLIFAPRLIAGAIPLVQIQASDYQVFWESVVYALIARGLGRRVLFRIGGAFDKFHGGAPPWERRLIARALAIPHVVIAQSGFARDYIRAAGRSGEIVVLPNWSRAENIRAEPAPPREIPTCLFIAGLEAQRKGIEEIIDAATRLQAEGSPARFHLVALPDSLKGRVAGLGLANIVAMEGMASSAHVMELMRSCDIFLLPSHGEGFPNSLIEAMGSGMACIATPVGAVPEMLGGGEGLVVPVGDGKALAEAIDRFARDPGLRGNLAERARQAVIGRYTAEAALPALADAYRRLLGEAGA